MVDGPFFVDTNIVMYAAGAAHPYKEPCVWVVTEIAAGRIPAVTDAEVVQEILYRYGALQRWQIACEMATSLFELLPAVLPVTPTDAKQAVELFAVYAPNGVKARDVIHVAVMQNNGIDRIISTDKHFDLVDGLVRYDPLDLYMIERSNPQE